MDYRSWPIKVLSYIGKEIGKILIWVGVILGIITALISIAAARSGESPLDVFVDIKNVVQGDIDITVELSSEDAETLRRFRSLVDDEINKRGLE